jgi:hypothetical protein
VPRGRSRTSDGAGRRQKIGRSLVADNSLSEIRTSDLCLRRAVCPRGTSCEHLLSCDSARATGINPRKSKDKSERLVTLARLPGMHEAGPRLPSFLVAARRGSQGVAGSPANCISGRSPQPVRINRRRRAGSADHRTSFAPETIVTRRNKHDRTRQISMKINASNSYPAAHNGLVGGSSPPGPTTHSHAN